MVTKKVALVTGSNKGIGLAIVRHLCNQFDGDVVLCSRDQSRGEAAIKSLESEGLKPKLVQLAIDDKASVTAVRDWLLAQYGGLDVLVNNAAIAISDETVKPRIEIVRQTFAINYWATADVCDMLFPILRPGARVVNISSSAGMLMRVTSEQLRSRLSSPSLTRHDIEQLIQEYERDVAAGVDQEKGWPKRATAAIYSTSKVFLSALTWVQNREFLSDPRLDLVINAVHPGYVNTDMTDHKGPLTIDEGAVAAVACCLIPANGQPRGQMVWFDGQVVDWVHDELAGTSAAAKRQT